MSRAHSTFSTTVQDTSVVKSYFFTISRPVWALCDQLMDFMGSRPVYSR